ncbi:MAG: tRNA pseudouridine(55) synthase TruB [Planctomycetes bacterium]|nr:tRNA pseudouridine(55) synthase TruB [Planctomycetota bacterium]
MQYIRQSQPVIITRDTLPDVHSLASFVLPVFKEPGYSSGFFVNQVRKRLSHARRDRQFKVGHAGTLDPFADGVLILLCGKATTVQDEWMRRPKAYEGVIRLGETTESLDPDTEVSARDEKFKLDRSALDKAIGRFIGEIDQIPPAYSAKHVEGKRAYELARAGTPPTLEAKKVRVDSMEILDVSGNDVRVRVVSGSGFYVRALARDLAIVLGTIGYLHQLRRTASGDVMVSDCMKLREILDAQPA